MGTADSHVVPPANRQPVTRGANLVVASGVVVGTWTQRAGVLTVVRFGEADPPDPDLLTEEVSRVAAVLGTDLDLNIASA